MCEIYEKEKESNRIEQRGRDGRDTRENWNWLDGTRTEW